MTNSNELYKTVENIRKAKYSNIPQRLVKSILFQEIEYEDDRSIAYKKITEIIREYIDQETADA